VKGISRRALTRLASALALLTYAGGALADPAQHDVLILVYHRFAASVTDSTTVRTDTFRSQLRFFEDNGYRVVPLSDVIAWHAGRQDNLPPRALVLSVDDGHRSVYEVLWPMLKGRSVPVTLFIYPSAISNASYAMTWDQLSALVQSGTFDVESHTEWHPNFKTERARLTPDAYRRFVHDQLRRSRARIEGELHRPVRLLAWPFGIYDTELEAIARDEGYTNGFSLDAKPVTPQSNAMALPRYLMTQHCDMTCLRGMLRNAQAHHD
jgi:peptidoglycan/xylan/chitin deacetylase (PgdA/CDA1 family)